MICIFIFQKVQVINYSEHHIPAKKNRNLVKCMSIVLPDEYVFDTIGPFVGNENEARITKAFKFKVNELKHGFRRQFHKG